MSCWDNKTSHRNVYFYHFLSCWVHDTIILTEVGGRVERPLDRILGWTNMYEKYIQHGIDLYFECWKKELVLKHKIQNIKYKARKSFSCPLWNTQAMKVYIQEICLLRKSSHNFQSLRRFCVYWKRSWIFKKDTLFEINIIHLIYHICHYILSP